ncbi:MAG: hypothetical protein QM564_08725 [Bergeyella sp.]
MTDWDGTPLGGEEGQNRSVNGILFFGIFLTGAASAEVNTAKSAISPQVQKVLDIIERMKLNGGTVKVNPLSSSPQVKSLLRKELSWRLKMPLRRVQQFSSHLQRVISGII